MTIQKPETNTVNQNCTVAQTLPNY